MKAKWIGAIVLLILPVVAVTYVNKLSDKMAGTTRAQFRESLRENYYEEGFSGKVITLDSGMSNDRVRCEIVTDGEAFTVCGFDLCGPRSASTLSGSPLTTSDLLVGDSVLKRKEQWGLSVFRDEKWYGLESTLCDEH